MKRLCGLVLVSGCVVTKPTENGFQDYVLMGTPTYENLNGRPSDPLQLEMIANMLPTVKVGLVAQDEAEGEVWRDLLDDEVSDSDLQNLVIFPIEHTDIWFRDMGGSFVQVEAKGLKTLAVVDFEFDGWGYGPMADDFQRELYAIDNQVASQLGDQMGIPVIYSPLIVEPGAFTSNGKGTLLYSYPAVSQRNPTWTQAQIETEFKRVLGVKKVIAMPVFHPADGNAVLDGPLELDGRFLHYPYTVRHTDEYLAFADDHTILVSQLPQEAVTNAIEQRIHDTLQTALDFLAAQTDQDGHPFNLIKYPDPGLLTETVAPDDIVWQALGVLQGLQHYDPLTGGEIILPASYMNFVLTNGKVLVPMFYQEGRNPRIMETDAEAVSILEAVFPDREVVQMNSDNIVVGGGGMHCIEQEVRSLSDFPVPQSGDDDDDDDDDDDGHHCDNDDDDDHDHNHDHDDDDDDDDDHGECGDDDHDHDHGHH